MQYRVTISFLAGDKKTLTVWKKKDMEHASNREIGEVHDGDVVQIYKIVGRRACMGKPYFGWVDFEGPNGEEYFKEADQGLPISSPRQDGFQARSTDKNGWGLGQTNSAAKKHSAPKTKKDEDALLECALLESKRQFIESQIQKTMEQMGIVRNHLEVNGPSLPPPERDDFQSTLSNLEVKAAAYLKAPFEWDCAKCTFTNQAESIKCEMCDAECTTTAVGLKELGELTMALAESLRQALQGRVVPPTARLLVAKHAEEEAARLTMAPAVREQSRYRASELILPPLTNTDTEMEVQTLRQRVNLLEEESWQRETEVEALKSQMMTMSQLISFEGRDPREWDVATVGVWLSKKGLQDYAEDFNFGNVDGEGLLNMSYERLKELEVGRKHRDQILLLVEQLKQKFPVAGVVEAPQEVERPTNETTADPPFGPPASGGQELAVSESPSPVFGPKEAGKPLGQEDSYVQFDEIGRPIGGESIAFSYAHVKTGSKPLPKTVTTVLRNEDGELTTKSTKEEAEGSPEKESPSPVLVKTESPVDKPSSLKELPLDTEAPTKAFSKEGKGSGYQRLREDSSDEEEAVEVEVDDYELL